MAKTKTTFWDLNKHIALRKTTIKRLLQHGRKGESYDTVVNRALDALEANGSQAPGT